MIEGLTVQSAIAHLWHIDQYRFLLENIVQRRNDAVRDLEKCKDPYMTMRASGKIIALTDVLDELMPDWDAPPPD